jgi:hypothetical protein
MLNTDFFQKHRTKIIIGLVSCMLISFLIPFTIALITRARMQTRLTEASEKEGEVTEVKKLSISDLYLNDHGEDATAASFYLLRDQFESWNKEQVDNYFIEPKKIIIEAFTQYNDTYIKEFFDKID